nr:hypothetical protein [uncultured Allomuricauda sp.]
MTYTTITLALVGFVLLFWLYNLMNNCFNRSFCILKNRKSGSVATKDASIISVNEIKSGKKPLLELLVLFQNFSGYHIHRKIRVWDSKPHLERFQPDNTIPIGINVARKPKDPIFLSQKMCRFSFALVMVCAIKLIIYVLGCYLLMGGVLQKVFTSPEKYEAVFKTSHTWQIGLMLIGVCGLLYLLLQKIGVLVNGKTMTQNWNLLYYGVRTTAAIIEHKSIGAFNKKNAVMQLTYVFKDHSGKQIRGEDKKIIDNEEVFSISEINHLEIMYLPNDSSTSRIVENLETNHFSRFLNIIFMIVAFIFSVVFVLSFYRTVFES